jgi:hypothetical protein
MSEIGSVSQFSIEKFRTKSSRAMHAFVLSSSWTELFFFFSRSAGNQKIISEHTDTTSSNEKLLASSKHLVAGMTPSRAPRWTLPPERNRHDSSPHCTANVLELSFALNSSFMHSNSLRSVAFAGSFFVFFTFSFFFVRFFFEKKI